MTPVLQFEGRHWMRIVVTGAAGRLGAVLASEFASAGFQVCALNRADLDVTNASDVEAVVKELRPQVIVNCTAFNAVDAAEAAPQAAFAVNAAAPGNLSRAAKSVGAALIHYSTDFVFDGDATEPYSEESATNALSVYGASKLAGENEVRKLRRHYILRLESLFGGSGIGGHRATLDQIADRIVAGSAVRAVKDRTVSPSYVADVARASRTLLERNGAYGTYHCVNSGFTTWYELAHEVSRRLGIAAEIIPTAASELPTPAPRPRFCALSNQKLLALGIDMPSWQVALARHLANRYVQPVADRVLQARIA
jgi:dTDP-4-dehydrorhamnose reductase